MTLVIKKTPWWNLVQHWRWWRALRELRRHKPKFFVPDDDPDYECHCEDCE